MAGISAVAAFPTAVVGFNVFVGDPALAGFPDVAVALLCCSIEKSNIVDDRTFRLRLSDWNFSCYRTIRILITWYRTIHFGKLSDYRLSKPGKKYRCPVLT